MGLTRDRLQRLCLRCHETKPRLAFRSWEDSVLRWCEACEAEAARELESQAVERYATCPYCANVPGSCCVCSETRRIVHEEAVLIAAVALIVRCGRCAACLYVKRLNIPAA
jgi:hypothetical protein